MVQPDEESKFVDRSSEIKNPNGSLVFKMDGVRVPESSSQVAVDVLVQKYFRKAGVQLVDEQGNPVMDEDRRPVTGTNGTRVRSSTGWPGAGPTGAAPTATSTPNRTHRLSETS